jgi:hypothetical protein
MPNISLADAIRLGSFLVPIREAHNVERCAITMALKAIGALPENLDDPRSYHGESRWNQWNTLAYPQRTMLDAYPWIASCNFLCRWCSLSLSGENVVSHPFDYHVMRGCRIAIEAFCGWIEEIDPTGMGIECNERGRCCHSAAQISCRP